MTLTVTPYRSDLGAGRDGFAQLLRAEWTKFRSVRGWVIGMLVAALVTVLLGLLSAAGSHTSCKSRTPSGPGPASACARPTGPVGPDGEAVTDAFYFVNRSLAGDGSLTVRVTALTGLIPPLDRPARAGQGPLANLRSGVEPWAKAGLILKASTTRGSPYAAIMITGGNGVRMQYNYTHDTAGSSGAVGPASPRWLRLTRSGDVLTGYESADGATWTQVGRAVLAGLPSTVPAGLFVASPDHQVTTQSVGGTSTDAGPAQATATVDHVSVQGRWSGGGWSGADIGGGSGGPLADGFHESGGTFTVSGSGDIAPDLGGPDGDPVERSLVGALAGLIVVIVVGTLFSTAEYRRGLIRTTVAASPRRGRVLAAKALVLGGVTFVVGLAGAAVAFWLVGRVRRANGALLLPVPRLTELRLVAGTAVLLAVAAVLAVAAGMVLRRSAGAVTALVVLLVLPYLLAVAAVLPAAPAQWLLRLTPAAAFAIQQSVPQYPQVSGFYAPANGFFPLAPWAGMAVLCGWTALALGLAAVLLRRRDA